MNSPYILQIKSYYVEGGFSHLIHMTVVNGTAIRGHHAREAFPYYAAQRQAGNISTARRGCGESAGAADDHAAKEYGAT